MTYPQMTPAQALEILNEGGRIGGNYLFVYDKNHKTVGKISQKKLDKLFDQGLLRVEYEQYFAA
jgi:hypothetical protein